MRRNGLLRGLRLLSALAVSVLAAMLIWQCVDIWRTGTAAREAGTALEPVFTAENVADRLRQLACPALICGAVLLTTGIAQAVGPAEKTKRRRSEGRRENEKYHTEENPLVVGWVRWILCTAAVLFILLGVMNGGLYDVLVKAINICTECIGLG